MQKINLDQLQQDINSRQLSVSEPPIKRTEQQERVIEETWETLTEIYGSTLAGQYGPTMPETWIMLLKGITPRQIKDGLNNLSTRDSAFPPNAAEFRQLCLPETIGPSGMNSDAYLFIDDPKHPVNSETVYNEATGEYTKRPKVKMLESDGIKSKRKEAGKSALERMKDSLS